MDTVDDVESSAKCAAMCTEDDDCMAWSYKKKTCHLKDAMPRHAYQADVTSGELPAFNFIRPSICKQNFIPVISSSLPHIGPSL